ncbi:MAG: hypothetical protein MZV64_56090 [Ignavibacteriales bacterium]|nr:hypothetical protein [Ignavibacteriales bacterium]
MLKLNAAPIFAARSIDKPNAFLRNNGFTANTASDVVTGKVKSAEFKTIGGALFVVELLSARFVRVGAGYKDN